MLRLDFVGLTVVVLAGATGRAQTTGCEVPDGLTATQKLSCIRAATLMLDQNRENDYDENLPDALIFR
jgi:hypothetical protein